MSKISWEFAEDVLKKCLTEKKKKRKEREMKFFTNMYKGKQYKILTRYNTLISQVISMYINKVYILRQLALNNDIYTPTFHPTSQYNNVFILVREYASVSSP